MVDKGQTQKRIRSRLPSTCRYTLMALHVVFWLVSLPVSVYYTGALIMLVMHAVAGFVMVIYLPTAILLSIRDGDSKFDHAGGEVAYVVVQMGIWMATFIIGMIFRTINESCSDDLMTGYKTTDERPRSCSALSAVCVFAFLELIITVIWTTWITWLAHHTPRRTPAQAFMIPAHRIIYRDYDDAPPIDLRQAHDPEAALAPIEPYDTRLSQSPTVVGGGERKRGMDEAPPGYTDPYYAALRPVGVEGDALVPAPSSSGVSPIHESASSPLTSNTDTSHPSGDTHLGSDTMEKSENDRLKRMDLSR